jgi:hypothetical protein
MGRLAISRAHIARTIPSQRSRSGTRLLEDRKTTAGAGKKSVLAKYIITQKCSRNAVFRVKMGETNDRKAENCTILFKPRFFTAEGAE